jgi:DDE superfamily endonuclease
MKASKSMLLDLYTDYLIAGVGQATSTGFSSVLNNQVTHDMATQLLGSGYISSRRLWSMVKPMCEEIEDENGVLIIDDSVEAKPYTDCNDMISWHFDHTENRSVKGVNFISAIYDNWKMSLPTGVCFVKKDISYIDKQGKAKRKSSISKQEHFRTLVKHGSQNLRFRYVLSDSWFACSENMQFVVEDCGRDFIMAMKENRKVALSKEDKANGKYISIKEAVSEGCVRSVYVEQLDFPLLIAKQVFKDGNGVAGTLYLACSDLGLSYEQATAIYKRRWKVEEYHKSIKSNTAFPKSPTKRVMTQQSHFIASIMAYVKMERLKIRCSKNHFALKSLMLVNATKAAWVTMQKFSEPKAA